MKFNKFGTGCFNENAPLAAVVAGYWSIFIETPCICIFLPFTVTTPCLQLHLLRNQTLSSPRKKKDRPEKIMIKKRQLLNLPTHLSPTLISKSIFCGIFLDIFSNFFLVLFRSEMEQKFNTLFKMCGFGHFWKISIASSLRSRKVNNLSTETRIC